VDREGDRCGGDVLRWWPRAAVLASFLAVAVAGAVYAGHDRPDDSSAVRRFTGKVHVALIDTGARLDLPEFSGYEVRQTDPSPSSDHGTMMLSALLGVLTEKPLTRESVLVTSIDVGGTTADGLAAAIGSAVDGGADVISISLGVRRDSPSLRSSVARARARGVLVVAAAGNVRFLPADYPARYPDVLSVGAVTATGELRPDSAQRDLGTTANGSDVAVLLPGGRRSVASGTSVATALATNDVVRRLVSGQLNDPLEANVHRGG
jgi:hypothetical protein